jgi:alpha-beta hydrolase superfamily lysophospholipase
MKRFFFRQALPAVVFLGLWPNAHLLAQVATTGTGQAPPADAKPVAPPDARPAEDQRPAAAKPEELVLETSDGVKLHAWHYPATVEEGRRPTATVILLHDFAGSHRSVESLAEALQAAGCDVVAPDLRGHGASVEKAGEDVDQRLLKKIDFELMAATRGGQIRDQSAIRGDVEAVRNWIKRRAEAGTLDMDRLVVVGSGCGAAVAAAWTAEDANWPPSTQGAQGRQVRGLVLISPAWTTRGFSIGTPLAHEAIRTKVPVLVIGGRDDSDARKVFEQIKRQRPAAWYRQFADGRKDPENIEDPAKLTAFFVEIDSTRSADALASDATLNAGRFIANFLGRVLARPQR